jgi:hypothetical protein
VSGIEWGWDDELVIDPPEPMSVSASKLVDTAFKVVRKRPIGRVRKKAVHGTRGEKKITSAGNVKLLFEDSSMRLSDLASMARTNDAALFALVRRVLE